MSKYSSDDFKDRGEPASDDEPTLTPATPPTTPDDPTPKQPSTPISSEERTWALFAHLAALSGYVGLPFGSVLGPLIVWLIKREEMPFVDEHGKESLNFHITVLIGIIVCLPLIFVCVGIPLIIALVIVDLVFTIIAAMKANEGKSYRYPWALRLIK